MIWPLSIVSRLLQSRDLAAMRRGAKLARRVRQGRDVSSPNPVNDGYWDGVRPESDSVTYSRQRRHLAIARCRHLAHNDDLVKNVIRSLKRHVVGTGPTIRFLLPNGTSKQEEFLADKLALWQVAVGYTRSLQGSVTEVAVAGESLRLLVYNSKIDHPIQLAIQQINPYRIADPAGEQFDVRDGVRVDGEGNVREFIVLDAPLYSAAYNLGKSEPYNADYAFWHVNEEEPGQPRYLPELGCVAMKAASLVSYNAAEINTAILASTLGVFMTSTDPHNIDSQFVDKSGSIAEEVEVLQIDQMQIVNAPAGKTIMTVDNKGANANYAPFVDKHEQAISRSIGVPKPIGTGSSEKGSYSANKADHREMQIEVDSRRHDLKVREIWSLARQWLSAAAVAYPREIRPSQIESAKIVVIWPGLPKLDPREHSADIALLQSGAMSLTEYAASKGRQLSEYLSELAADYNLTIEEVQQLLAQKNLGALSVEK